MATGFTPLSFTALRTFIVQQFQAALVAAGITPPADIPGTQPNALFNASTAALYQQQLQIQAAQVIARLATSTGPDVDSFVAPFGITRLAASAASGAVTISTPSPVPSQVVIPIGAIVQASNGLQFAIVVDTTNASYSASYGGYIIPAGQSSVNVTVQCTSVGTIGNVSAGQINQIYSAAGVPPLTGISTVNNAAAFTNAINSETDAQLKSRFTTRMSAGIVGTGNALATALLGVQAGLTYSIADLFLVQIPAPQTPPLTTTAGGTQAARMEYVRTTYVGSGGETTAGPEVSISVPTNSVVQVPSPPVQAGASSYNVYAATASGAETKQNSSPIAIGTQWQEPNTGLVSGAAMPASNTTGSVSSAPGWCTIYLGLLGTGTGPSSTLLNAVQAAVNAVKSAGDSVPVLAPTLVPVACTATIKIGPTGVATVAQTAAIAAVNGYLNGIGLDPAGGTTLAQLGALYQLLLAIPGVSGVPVLTLNGSQADVSSTLGRQIVAGTVTVSTA